MAFKTKREKNAFKIGLFAGIKKGRKRKRRKVVDTPDQKAWRKNMLVWDNGSSYSIEPRKKSSKKRKTKRGTARGRASDNPFGMTYMQLIREDEQRKRDLFGDFDYDSRGKIKGSYTVDGKFEPD